MKPSEYRAVVKRKRTCKVLTIAPGISSDLILAEGEHPLQVGHVPFFFWSAKSLWGESQGVIDLLFDAQEVLNKDEASVTEILGKAANSGLLGDTELIPDKEQQEKLVTEGNKPGTVIWATSTGGRSIKDAVVPLQSANVPPEVLNRLERTRQFLQSFLPAPMQGMGQGANESNQKFSATLSQSLVKFEPLNQILPAAKQVYSGTKRRLFNRKTKKAFQINRPLAAMPEGEDNDSVIAMDDKLGLPVENPVEILDRYDVLVMQSPRGATMRDEMSRQSMNIVSVTQNPLLRSEAEGVAIENLVGVPEEQKDRMREAVKVYSDFQKKQLVGQGMQMDMQTQQMQQQMQPQPQPGMVPGAPPMGPKEIAKGPGMGPIPDNVGIAGTGNMAKSMQAPSENGAGR
jgi:hypothetical protein